VKELVAISGKGGTGKPSVAASFADLADRPDMADPQRTRRISIWF